MSGGVDSSVTAYLLKKQGYRVQGVFLKLKFPDCSLQNWREAEGRAYLSAKTLGIPIMTLDASRDFKEKVWKPFWSQFKKGLTPNPCPICNPNIKFGVLFDKIRTLGYDYLATGHYARLTKNKGYWTLRRGKDKTKDQSYFLYRLNPKIFPYLKFPLGECLKKDIKRMAQKIFPTRLYRVKESQGICFAAGQDFRELTKAHLPVKKCNIVDTRGKIIGQHKGIWFYTEGQRTGIGNFDKSGLPAFIAKKLPRANKLVVTHNPKDLSLNRNKLVIGNINWFISPRREFSTKVQIRYGSTPVPAKIKLIFTNKAKITLAKPQRAVTPGQSAVFYHGERVLGGGEIEE